MDLKVPTYLPTQTILPSLPSKCSQINYSDFLRIPGDPEFPILFTVHDSYSGHPDHIYIIATHVILWSTNGKQSQEIGELFQKEKWISNH